MNKIPVFLFFVFWTNTNKKKTLLYYTHKIDRSYNIWYMLNNRKYNDC